MIVSAPWRWAAGILAGASCGSVVGWIEGAAAAAGTGSLVSAGILGAGLGAIPGLIVGLACAGGILILAGARPGEAAAGRLRALRSSPDAAAASLAGSLAAQLGAAAWAVLVYHAARISLGAFHHMGLAALLLTAVAIGAAGLIGLAARAASKAAAPVLARVIPHRRLLSVALATLALPAAVLAVAITLSPVDGGGALGFLGLLRREELELGFAGLLLLPALATASAVIFAGARAARLLPALAFVAGSGLACTCLAATRYYDDPAATYAVERSAPLGGRLIAVARRLSDLDGDGASALFAGGDCDDRDPARWPGALDLPGNGVDEDCSGADLALPGEAPVQAEEAAAPTPGIGVGDLSLLVISVDALRWDLGFTGYERPISPSIDAAAARGIVFEKAYAMSSFTGRCIAPIFIGRHPTETWCSAAHLSTYRERNDMLAESLAAAGFATGAVHGHPYFNRSGIEQGFDRWTVVTPPGDGDPDQKISSPLIAKAATELLADPSFTGARFFMWVHFMDPHKDYLAHEGYDFGASPRDLYDGEVAFTDHHVGLLLRELEERGLAGRTVVVITGDHGEAFMEHDIRFHGRRLWEEVVRVPWIWIVPGLGHSRVPSRVSHVDFAATVYELLGVKPPPQARGRSLVPMMTGGPRADRRIFLDQPLGKYMPQMYAVIDGGLKLIHTVSGNRYQLFDLDEDPGETNDLARTDPERLARMKRIYQETRGSLEVNADEYRGEPQ